MPAACQFACFYKDPVKLKYQTEATNGKWQMAYKVKAILYCWLGVNFLCMRDVKKLLTAFDFTNQQDLLLTVAECLPHVI